MKDESQTKEDDQLHVSSLQIGSLGIIAVGCIMILLKFDFICISMFLLLLFILMSLLLTTKEHEIKSQKEANTDAGDICEDDCIGNGLL